MMTTAPTAIAAPSRGRWLIGLGIAGVAIGLALVAALVLGGRQTPEALRYVPADAVVVAELRLDLPGDQLQKVGNLLAHFPGFADQSTLAGKLDEAGDRLLGMLTNGRVGYTADLKPWISGPAFVAFRDAAPSPRLGLVPPGLLVATTNGVAGCYKLFTGRATSSESYRGLQIEVLADGRGACVVDDRHVLAGDVGSLKAGLDAHAEGRGIDATERYRAAREALGGEQLATLFVSAEAAARLEGLAGFSATPFLLGQGALPAWSIVGIRAEDNALVLDAVSAGLPESSAAPSLTSLSPSHPSQLTRHVPLDALVYAELQGAGTIALNGLTLLRAEPLLADGFVQLDELIEAFGGAEQLVGWVDDAAFVVLNDGGLDMVGDFVGGLLLQATDAATAEARVGAYRSLLGIAALGGQIDLRTSTLAGVEVTTVVVSDAMDGPATGPLEVSFAVRDRLVVIGTSEGFIERALGRDGDGPLAESRYYQDAKEWRLDRARGTFYLAVASAVHYLRLQQPSGRFDPDVLPYVSPIKAIYMTAIDGPGPPRARIVMTVSDPKE